MNYEIKKIKLDFPILRKKINKNKIIYLDNASTTQKPKIVINYINKIYKNYYSSVYRSIYTLSNKNSNKIEKTRIKIANFINAKSPEEIIFVQNTTEGINLIINTICKKKINKKNNIIISITEHHANLIPWYILSKKKKCKLKIIHIDKQGNIDINHLKSLIDKNTKILSITHISNVLGIKNPIKKIIKITKKFNIITIIDGSQSIVHTNINVKKINCDFYIFSGHKMYAPTGTGIIYCKKNMMKYINPYKFGGGIVANINIKKNNIKNIKFVNSPWKFESGTYNLESILGLNKAINYINNIGLHNIIKHEKKIINYTLNKLKSIPEITIYGNLLKTSLISFNIKNSHCYDIGMMLDQYGISIRTGNQCCIPLMKLYNIPGVCRVSIAMYTSKKDINTFIYILKKIIKKIK